MLVDAGNDLRRRPTVDFGNGIRVNRLQIENRTALLPALLSGFKNAVSAGEAVSSGSAFPALGGLLGTIGSLGGGKLLDNAIAAEPTQVDKDNEILGQVLGSKDGSRAVATSAAGQSGVEPSLLKKMLPILAMPAAGYVMKNAGKAGGLGCVQSGV